MNPVVFELGSLTLRAYTAWLIAGVLAGLLILAARAPRGTRARWLDVGIVAVIAGVAGARALHVVLEWNYFSAHRDELAALGQGGLAWHGALLLGLPAALLTARARGVPLRAWQDAAALAWPVGLSAAWWACRRAGCGYGYEVWTLADWPGWLVEELPDVYGQIAPRLDVQALGALWGIALLALALLLTWPGWLRGLRLWPILALTGLGQALLAFLRADPAPQIGGHRADQVLDLALLWVSTLIGGMIWLADRRAAARTAARAEGGIRDDA